MGALGGLSLASTVPQPLPNRPAFPGRGLRRLKAGTGRSRGFQGRTLARTPFLPVPVGEARS